MITSIRGFRDIFEPESKLFASLESIARRAFGTYSYSELRIPAVEMHELFVKSTGETTDVVEKEMYSFQDAGERRLALRPEGTPGVARAYIQHNLNSVNPRQKLFYIGGMYRAERPQKGRYREFEQIGVEYIGNAAPSADAETIILLSDILKEAGLARFSVELNSLGCGKCRPAYRESLINFLHKCEDTLCEHCRGRIDKNPLRALDCKIDGPAVGQNAPVQELCPECADHFAAVQKYLDDAGVRYAVNRNMVRGLDYYTKTVFEFKTDLLGSQDSIAGGGRYDSLIKSMGGPDVPAVGWAFGADRVVSMMPPAAGAAEPLKAFVISMGGTADLPAFRLLSGLRRAGVKADGGDFAKSFKAQLRAADKSGAEKLVIIGENEVLKSTCMVKDLKTGGQTEIPALEITTFLGK
ncbi:MAG: histidine--tRNA ligase [Elusimicrobiaceae bacterium]